MITTTFDGSGNQTGTTNTSASGGSSVSVSAIKLGTFWSNGSMPTSDTSFIDVIQQANNSPVAALDASFIATRNGYVNVLTVYANGGTSGSDCIATVYKNGTALSLTATVNVPGGGNAAAFYGNGGATFSYVKGDLFKVKMRSANSGVNQSFSAALEVINS